MQPIETMHGSLSLCRLAFNYEATSTRIDIDVLVIRLSRSLTLLLIPPPRFFHFRWILDSLFTSKSCRRWHSSLRFRFRKYNSLESCAWRWRWPLSERLSEPDDNNLPRSGSEENNENKDTSGECVPLIKFPSPACPRTRLHLVPLSLSFFPFFSHVFNHVCISPSSLQFPCYFRYLLSLLDSLHSPRPSFGKEISHKSSSLSFVLFCPKLQDRLYVT